MSRQENFLKDLTRISKKHKITIDGCGCCASPYLVLQDTELKGKYEYLHEDASSEIEWIDDKYEKI